MTALVTRPPYALRRTMDALWASMGPMDVDLAPSDFRRVAEWATIDSLAPRGQVVCIIDGQYISRRDWWQPVRPGDVIVFRDVSAIYGRDQNGNSDALRTVLAIVVVIAAVVTQQYYAAAGYAGSAGAAAGLSAAQTGALYGAAVSIGGSLLINAILPNPTAAGGFSNPAAGSPTYSVAGSGNAARIGQSIPVRYGQEFFYPDFAGQPYSEFDSAGDQYYCAVLGLGYGHFNVVQVTIDDTDIRAFDDVEVAICGPGASTRIQPFPGYELLSEQDLAESNMLTASEVTNTSFISDGWIGAFVAVPSGRLADRYFVDIVAPSGIGSVNPSTGDVGEYSVGLQVAFRPVNDIGQPLGAWDVQPQIVITASSREAIRRSYGFSVPAGRYQARMRRTFPRPDNQLVLADLVWAGLRARLSVPGITRTDCTHVVVRMRASEQLSGLSQRKIGVNAQRLIPVWNATTQTWSAPVFTRNPAHAYADILHDNVEGRGLPDNRIDLVTLADLAEVYDARQDHFDYSFDSRRTVDEALRLVARAGRARPILRRGAVYSLVRDELQDTPVALFMPRNIQQDSFSLSFKLNTEETPDCVRMEYRNGRTWQTSYVYGQIVDGAVVCYPSDSAGLPLRPAGVPEPQRVQDERLAGVIGEKHALREVAFLVADALYRPISCSWKTELEGLLPTIGSLVGTAHDVAGWGQSGDVSSYDTGTRTLVASEPLAWQAGQTHYVRLQTDTGGAGPAIVVTRGADEFEMVLATAPAVAPVYGSTDRERTRYLFGALADVTRYTRITRIQPESQTDITLAAVLEDVRVHSADAAFLPGPGEIQDPLTTATEIATGAPETADFIVRIDNQRGIWEADSSSDNRIRRYEVRNDGTFKIVVGSGNEYLVVGNWLSGAPVSISSAALFEVRCTVREGALNGASAPAGTWHNLGTSRTFESAVGLPRSFFYLEVRDVATQTLQDDADLISFP